MQEVKLCIILLTVIYFIYEIHSDSAGGFEAIPERADIVYINEKYVRNSTVNVRRYNRRGAYVINFWVINRHTWANNVTVDVIFYEYLHNEYKRSFVELHYKLCDMINKDEFIGPGLRQHGMKCPLEAGLNGIMNATLSFPKFSYVIPFQRCKAEVIYKTEPSHDLIGKGNIYLNIKEYKSKPKKN